MSRSYKKFPLFKDSLWGKSTKKGKQFANRQFRHKYKKNVNLDIPKGGYYKKLGINSWEIWEYKSYMTKADIIADWEKNQIEFENGVNYYTRYKPTLEETLIDWFISYKRK